MLLEQIEYENVLKSGRTNGSQCTILAGLN